MAEIRYLENRHNVIFFCRGWSDLDKISQTGAEWHVDCGDMVEIETRCRIPIWRTFWRIQSHVIPEPPATRQGAAIRRIQCHEPRATCDVIWLIRVRIGVKIITLMFAIAALKHIILCPDFFSNLGLYSSHETVTQGSTDRVRRRLGDGLHRKDGVDVVRRRRWGAEGGQARRRRRYDSPGESAVEPDDQAW